MASRIDAEKVNFQKVFSQDFWFVIPEYQRSYVWNKDNISELLDDLRYAFENKPDNDYFLGSLVLKNLNNPEFKEYEVLDGQQRLTTLFIMMAVMRDMETNQDYKVTLQKKIFQKKDDLEGVPERVRIKYKIRDDVEALINDVLIKEQGTADDNLLKSFQNKDNISIVNMSNAVLEMRKILSDMAKTSQLSAFAKFIFQYALFIYVSTDNTEDAFRMFTILNDRGIPLTNADILKSENIGALSSSGIKSQEERKKEQAAAKRYARLWEEIEGKHEEKFDRFLQFIRTIYVKDKARTNLLDEFKTKIYDAAPPLLTKGRQTLDAIIRYNDIYEAVIDLQEQSLPNSYKNLITIMKGGMRSDDWIPPVLYFYDKFGDELLYEFLQELEYKFTADWVCGITPTFRIDAMNRVLQAIEQYPTPQKLLSVPGLFEVDEDEFRTMLKADVYTKRYAKMLLLKIEFLLGENDAHIEHYGTISVEHVLPQTPGSDSEWADTFSPDEQKRWVHKLANLVLLSRKKNSKLGNYDFEQKKEKYFNTRMDIFRANKIFIERQTDWTPTVLKKRQRYLLDLLVSNEPSSVKELLAVR